MSRFSNIFSTPLLICLVFLFRLSFTSLFHGPVNTISLNGSYLKSGSLNPVKKRRRNLHVQRNSFKPTILSVFQAAELILAKTARLLLKKINPLILSFLESSPIKVTLKGPRPPGFFDLFLIKQPSPVSLSIFRVCC